MVMAATQTDRQTDQKGSMTLYKDALSFTSVIILGANNQRFVCVEVLRPSQPIKAMSSAVSLPNHTCSWAGLGFYVVNQ